MKPLPPSNSYSESVEGVRLYRDDCERLIGILEGAGLAVRITDDDSAFDSLEDLHKMRGDSPRHLKLVATGRSGLTMSTLSYNRGRWFLHSMEPKEHGAMRECEALLRRRRTKWQDLPRFIVGGAGAVLFVVASTQPPIGVWVPLRHIGLDLMLLVFFANIYVSMYEKLVLRRRHEAGFWARNKDQVYLAVLGAVVGAVLAGLACWLTD